MNTITNKQIFGYLDKYHLSHISSGFLYIFEGLRMLLDEEVDRDYIIVLYEKIAEKHQISSDSVEKGITRALRKAGLSETNKEFIFTAMDRLIYDL